MSGKSFVKGIRLNPDVPEEKQVIDIIEEAERNGHDFKSFVMTLILDAHNIVTDSPLSVANELAGTVEELKTLLSNLQSRGLATVHETPQEPIPEDRQVQLDDKLIASLKGNMKSGRRRKS